MRARPQVTPDAYIASAAQARGLYVVLFEACLTAMPVTVLGQHDVECHYTIKDLMEKLPGRSASVISNELRWLTNNTWMMNKAGSLRYLGQRVDGVFHLVADMAAHQITMAERLVSKTILKIELPGPPVTAETTKRGPGRRWHGQQTQGGGALDLGTTA